jgi:hypothetical protein
MERDSNEIDAPYEFGDSKDAPEVRWPYIIQEDPLEALWNFKRVMFEYPTTPKKPRRLPPISGAQRSRVFRWVLSLKRRLPDDEANRLSKVLSLRCKNTLRKQLQRKKIRHDISDTKLTAIKQKLALERKNQRDAKAKRYD